MGPQRGYNAGRQDTNDFENAIPATDISDGRSTSGYLAEKDHNSQLPSDYNRTSSASSMTNGYHHTRYNREYPNGGRNFSSYKSRYHQHQFSSNANRDTHSIHSNFSASHQKNFGASSSTDTSSTTSSGYNNCENSWRPPRNHTHHNRQYSNYYGYNKENSGHASMNHVSGNGKLELKIHIG